MPKAAALPVPKTPRNLAASTAGVVLGVHLKEPPKVVGVHATCVVLDDDASATVSSALGDCYIDDFSIFAVVYRVTNVFRNDLG